jgi:mannose-6-phosphate isomerase-like protein (cupin superfamily)
MAGLSPGYLSKIERSDKGPPISTLSNIASALGVDLSDLLIEDTDPLKDSNLAIVRKDKRKIVQTKGSFYGYEYEALAYNKLFKNMEPFIISPAFDKETTFLHEGEEYHFILEGTVEFHYEGQKYVLNEGDSLYFDSGLPHTGISIGKKKARILAVLYPYKKKPYI